MTKKQKELIKYAITLKNKKILKTRSIKPKKPLFEYETVTDINLGITGNLFPPVSNETAPEVEENRIKLWQSSKTHRLFQTNVFKAITDLR